MNKNIQQMISDIWDNLSIPATSNTTRSMKRMCSISAPLPGHSSQQLNVLDRVGLNISRNLYARSDQTSREHIVVQIYWWVPEVISLKYLYKCDLLVTSSVGVVAMCWYEMYIWRVIKCQSGNKSMITFLKKYIFIKLLTTEK